MGATIFLIKSQFDESESDQFTHTIDPVQKTRLPTVSPELDAFQQWGLLLLLSGCPHSCGPKYVMFGDTCKCSVLKKSLLSGASDLCTFTVVRRCVTAQCFVGSIALHVLIACVFIDGLCIQERNIHFTFSIVFH